jgi:hypothetical protein
VSSVTVASGVVGLARIAHETAHVADEVGAVVKAGITVAAQAEFVLVMLLRALLFSQFEAGSVLFGSSCHGSSVGSSSPVVGSRGSRHCSSFVSESGRYHLDKCRKSISILLK